MLSVATQGVKSATTSRSHGDQLPNLMKRIAVIVAATLLPVVAAEGRQTALGTSRQAVIQHTGDLTGLWQLTLTRFGQIAFEARAEMTSSGSQVSGTAAAGAWNELKFEGSIERNVISFRATRRGQPFATFTGQIKGDEINGTATDG